jgi:hypothetical protein
LPPHQPPPSTYTMSAQTLLGQFKSLPYPEQDCSNRTIIITGANTGTHTLPLPPQHMHPN